MIFQPEQDMPKLNQETICQKAIASPRRNQTYHLSIIIYSTNISESNSFTKTIKQIIFQPEQGMPKLNQQTICQKAMAPPRHNQTNYMSIII